MTTPAPHPENLTPTLGLHHVAYGTRATEATYDFYNNKLGMPLIHTELHRVKKGYFRHFFFDMGCGQHLAFFEIHDVGEQADYRTDPSTGLGMPVWVTHISFRMNDKASYDALLKRCQDKGLQVMSEVDHDFCQSFYLIDPNFLMVEFTYDTDLELFGKGGHDEAYRRLFLVKPEEIGEDAYKGVKNNPKIKMHI